MGLQIEDKMEFSKKEITISICSNQVNVPRNRQCLQLPNEHTYNARVKRYRAKLTSALRFCLGLYFVSYSTWSLAWRDLDYKLSLYSACLNGTQHECESPMYECSVHVGMVVLKASFPSTSFETTKQRAYLVCV
jgi:hypothetical protein